MNRGSLRLRLFLAGAVSILVALLLSAIGLPVLFEHHVERRVVIELGTLLDQIVSGLDRDTTGVLFQSKTPADPRFSQPFSGLYWQVEGDGGVLRSRSLWDTQLTPPADALADGAVHHHRIAGPNDAELLAAERSVTLPPRLGGGTVRADVALDTADTAKATRAFAVDLLPYVAVIALFLMAAAYAQVTVGLWPMATVRAQLSAIRRGTAHRLGQAFPDEVQPLAAEVDALLDAREARSIGPEHGPAILLTGSRPPCRFLPETWSACGARETKPSPLRSSRLP